MSSILPMDQPSMNNMNNNDMLKNNGNNVGNLDLQSSGVIGISQRKQYASSTFLLVTVGKEKKNFFFWSEFQILGFWFFFFF